MLLKMMPARGGLGWVWVTPAWAVMVRPTISAVAATVSTAVIQRRMRRVIAISFCSMRPAVCGSLVVRSRGPGGWSRIAGQQYARPRAGALTLPDQQEGAADRSGARPRRLVKSVEAESCEGRVGVGLVHASLGGDGQADHQRGGGHGQHCRDPKAYTPGHRGLLHSMRPRGLR